MVVCVRKIILGEISQAVFLLEDAVVKNVCMSASVSHAL